MAAVPFVDHYAVLGCDGGAPLDQLKRAYHVHLREFHPDKRPGSPRGEEGQRATLALNAAWAVLREPTKRDAYDDVWRRERSAAATASTEETPDGCRRLGNELYKVAQSIQKRGGADITCASKAMEKYTGAIEKYSKGIELDPYDHRFYSNRSLCFFALGQWVRCREDAERTVQLKADYMKGWFMLVRVLCREGALAAAVERLDAAQWIIPQSPELQALRLELDNGGEFLRGDQSVSPACTPQRFATPPSLRRPMPPTGPSPGGNRLASTSPARGQDTTVGTAQFGDATGDFGVTSALTRGHTPPRPNRWGGTGQQATPLQRPSPSNTPPRGRPGAEFSVAADSSATFGNSATVGPKPPTPPRAGSVTRAGSSFWERAIGRDTLRERGLSESVVG